MEVVDRHISGKVDTLYDEKMLNKNGGIKEFEQCLNDIEKIHEKNGRILDVGCFEGLFLLQAKNTGRNAMG